MTLEDSRQAGAVEITPDMIDAGCDFLAEWDSPYYDGRHSPASSFVSELFRRMVSKVANPTEVSAIPE
jgi:hypothetical protein